MEENRLFFVFLSMFDLSYQKCQQIVTLMGDNLTLKNFKKTNFDKILTSEIYEKMKAKADENVVNNFISYLDSKEITIVTKFDYNFPKKLQPLPDCPFYLFCKGDLNLFNLPSISIIGTRKPSNYGRFVTSKFAGELSKNGLVIVSGLAYGIDSIAHKECLKQNGKTIAVLGSGINNIYPSEHYSLAQEIATKGLIVSEYLPDKSASKYSFPQRNRIIAGLSDGVLITEANVKSGTIHTRDFALDYGKALYAIPGNIDSITSNLPNEIIKCGQASCVTSVDDILIDYNLNKSNDAMSFQLSIEEQIIVSLLNDGMKDVDFLTKKSGLPVNIFNSCLTTMEIRGIINRLPGGNIVLT